jgi:hypothetical protein
VCWWVLLVARTGVRLLFQLSGVRVEKKLLNACVTRAWICLQHLRNGQPGFVCRAAVSSRAIETQGIGVGAQAARP